MKVFIVLSFAVLSLYSLTCPVRASDAEISMPKEIIGAWGDDNQCLAYHRNNDIFILEKSGYFYLEHNAEKLIEHWFLNPRIEEGAMYLSVDLAKDSRPVLGVIHREGSDQYLEYLGINEEAHNAIRLRKCAFEDMLKGIGHDPLKSDNKELEKTRHISFALGYAMGAVQICEGIEIHDDTARYIAELAMQSALKFAEDENKLPPEKWVQNFVSQRTLGAISVASIDREAIPNFCGEVVKAYGEGGRVVDGLIKPVDAHQN